MQIYIIIRKFKLLKAKIKMGAAGRKTKYRQLPWRRADLPLLQYMLWFRFVAGHHQDAGAKEYRQYSK
jgi:hypothetical protein